MKKLFNSAYFGCGVYSQYDAAMKQRELERKEFRRSNRKFPFPQHLLEETFQRWFPTEIERLQSASEKVDEDCLCMCIPPSRTAKSYQSMYAYGNHLCVRSAETHLTTADSGVAATF